MQSVANGSAVVQWDSIQMDFQVAVGQNANSDKTTGKQIQPLACPLMFKGCIAHSSLSNDSMNAALFGDATTGKNPVLPSLVEPFQSAITNLLWPLNHVVTNASTWGKSTFPDPRSASKLRIRESFPCRATR